MSGFGIALFFVKSHFRARHFYCCSVHRPGVTLFVRSKLVLWAKYQWNPYKVETPARDSVKVFYTVIADEDFPFGATIRSKKSSMLNPCKRGIGFDIPATAVDAVAIFQLIPKRAVAAPAVLKMNASRFR